MTNLLSQEGKLFLKHYSRGGLPYLQHLGYGVNNDTLFQHIMHKCRLNLVKKGNHAWVYYHKNDLSKT